MKRAVLRSTVAADAAAVTGLVVVLESSLYGESTFSQSDLEDEWSDLGRGIGTILASGLEADATRRGAHAIRNSVLEADAAGRRLLEWLGYVAVRVFREMRIELDAPPHAPAWPDGLRAAPFDPDSNAAHTRSTLSATAEFAMNRLAQSVNTRDGLAGMKLGRSPRSHRTPPRRVRDPSRGHKRSRGCPNGCRRRRFSRGSVRCPDVRALGGNTPESPWPSRTRHCGGDGDPGIEPGVAVLEPAAVSGFVPAN